jgi:hypothetical protein
MNKKSKTSAKKLDSAFKESGLGEIGYQPENIKDAEVATEDCEVEVKEAGSRRNCKRKR